MRAVLRLSCDKAGRGPNAWATAMLVSLASLGSAGCQNNKSLSSLFNGAATRVPPPATSSYGSPAPYYGPNQPPPTAPGLPPVTTQPPTTPPPPAVPATGFRNAPGSNSTSSYSPDYRPGPDFLPGPDYRPGSDYRPGPESRSSPTVNDQIGSTSTAMLPTVPPTYLSTPARVDTLIQPASALEPPRSTMPLVPATGLRWGVR
jgi:hypothetical protein